MPCTPWVGGALADPGPDYRQGSRLLAGQTLNSLIGQSAESLNGETDE